MAFPTRHFARRWPMCLAAIKTRCSEHAQEHAVLPAQPLRHLFLRWVSQRKLPPRQLRSQQPSVRLKPQQADQRDRPRPGQPLHPRLFRQPIQVGHRQLGPHSIPQMHRRWSQLRTLLSPRRIILRLHLVLLRRPARPPSRPPFQLRRLRLSRQRRLQLCRVKVQLRVPLLRLLAQAPQRLLLHRRQHQHCLRQMCRLSVLQHPRLPLQRLCRRLARVTRRLQIPSRHRHSLQVLFLPKAQHLSRRPLQRPTRRDPRQQQCRPFRRPSPRQARLRHLRHLRLPCRVIQRHRQLLCRQAVRQP
mmetsp:Transcript_22415/g.67440  ORF Transcript_22415/g.67440 Transcript_22415/m.67440 type:complete len:302 (-) Transcript_22415:5660-6565(-)